MTIYHFIINKNNKLIVYCILYAKKFYNFILHV